VRVRVRVCVCVDRLVVNPHVRCEGWQHIWQMSRDTGNRAEKLFSHSSLGWGATIRKFLWRHEAAAMRLVCTKLLETVDDRWSCRSVRGPR
jgi:hypothetical protein